MSAGRRLAIATRGFRGTVGGAATEVYVGALDVALVGELDVTPSDEELVASLVEDESLMVEETLPITVEDGSSVEVE